MSVNKKECRRFADPGLLFSPGDGLLHFEQIKHLVRSALKNIAGRRVLILFFYDRKKTAEGKAVPEYTLFQYKDDYITLWRADDGTTKWLQASLDNIGAGYPWFTKNCAFYRQADEQRVNRFCGDPGKTGFQVLEHMQRVIMAKRLAERIKKRERKTVDRMKPIPFAPRGLNNWIFNEVLPHYIFYEYKRGGKPTNGYCTACRRDVTVSGATHNAAGKCPDCRKTVTFKARGRAKKVWDFETVQVLQKINGGSELVLRIFKVRNVLWNYREPVFTVWENARVFVQCVGQSNMKTEPYYYSYNRGILTKWQKGERPRGSLYYLSFECIVSGHLYCRNLDGVLERTPWQYSQLERFYKKDREPLEVIPYLYAYLSYPAIEYLVKLGLTNLAVQIVYRHEVRSINTNGKNLREALGVGPEDLPVLQKLNADAAQLELYKLLKAQGIQPGETLLRWYQDSRCRDKDNLLFPLRYVTPHKLMGYIDGQFEKLKANKTDSGYRRFENPGSVLSEYSDYLSLGRRLGYDLKNSFVLFPRSLKAAHDWASASYKHNKTEILNKTIAAAYELLTHQYGFAHNGYVMLAPKTADEIVTEGHALHHCVGGFIESVVKQERIILFLRREDSVDSPFYTVELRDGKITQSRGMQNGNPTPEVQMFLNVWERRKLLTVPIAA